MYMRGRLFFHTKSKNFPCMLINYASIVGNFKAETIGFSRVSAETIGFQQKQLVLRELMSKNFNVIVNSLQCLPVL